MRDALEALALAASAGAVGTVRIGLAGAEGARHVPALLSLLPETLPPNDYVPILASLVREGRIVAEDAAGEEGEFEVDPVPNYKKCYVLKELSGAALSLPWSLWYEWIAERATNIYDFSGSASPAREFLRLCLDAFPHADLAVLHHTMGYLDRVPTTHTPVSWARFTRMSPTEHLTLLTEGVTVENGSRLIEGTVLPYLAGVIKAQNGQSQKLSEEAVSIICDWICGECTTGNALKGMILLEALEGVPATALHLQRLRESADLATAQFLFEVGEVEQCANCLKKMAESGTVACLPLCLQVIQCGVLPVHVLAVLFRFVLCHSTKSTDLYSLSAALSDVPFTGCVGLGLPPMHDVVQSLLRGDPLFPVESDEPAAIIDETAASPVSQTSLSGTYEDVFVTEARSRYPEVWSDELFNTEGCADGDECCTAICVARDVCAASDLEVRASASALCLKLGFTDESPNFKDSILILKPYLEYWSRQLIALFASRGCDTHPFMKVLVSGVERLS